MNTHEFYVRAGQCHEILGKFAEDLKSFHEKETSGLKEIERTVQNLSSSFEGDAFDKLSSTISGRITDIRSIDKKLVELTSKIEARAQEFKELLEEMRRNGDV